MFPRDATTRWGRRDAPSTGLSVVLLSLLLCAVPLAVILATPTTATADQVVRFAPAFDVLGTADSNFLRAEDEELEFDTFLTYSLELPLTIRGPRWEGRLRYRPSYWKRSGGAMDGTFDHLASMELRGDLSPRTSMTARGRFSLTPQISGLTLDTTGQTTGDVAVPSPADRLRADVGLGFDHRLSRADAVHVGFTYGIVAFPDEEFSDEQRVGGQIGYSRRLSPRLDVRATGRGTLFGLFDLGDVRSFGAATGLSYRLSPRTSFEAEVGAALLSGDLQSSGVTADVDLWEPTFDARLRYAFERVSLGIGASRRFDVSGGLGQPTRRTVVNGSLAMEAPRYLLVATAGYGINELVMGDEGRSLLADLLGRRIAVGGLDRFETFTTGVESRLRITRWLSVVGRYDFVHQIPDGGADDFAFDSHRVAVGLSLQAFAPPLNAAGGSER